MSTAPSLPVSAAHLSTSAKKSTAPVFEFLCLFTHDLRRKQKRWQDGRLKYHVFNKRVMVYDERGNSVGDMHWRADWEFDEGEEIELERGGVLVQVSECVGRQSQDLSELLDKPAQEKEQRQARLSARSTTGNNTTTPVVINRAPPSSDHPLQLRHIPLNHMLGTPTGHPGRARIPVESPFEQRQSTVDSPGDSNPSRASKRRKIDEPPPSRAGYAQNLFGAALSLSGGPPSSAASWRRPLLTKPNQAGPGSTAPPGEDEVQRTPGPPLQSNTRKSWHTRPVRNTLVLDRSEKLRPGNGSAETSHTGEGRLAGRRGQLHSRPVMPAETPPVPILVDSDCDGKIKDRNSGGFGSPARGEEQHTARNSGLTTRKDGQAPPQVSGTAGNFERALKKRNAIKQRNRVGEMREERTHLHDDNGPGIHCVEEQPDWPSKFTTRQTITSAPDIVAPTMNPLEGDIAVNEGKGPGEQRTVLRLRSRKRRRLLMVSEDQSMLTSEAEPRVQTSGLFTQRRATLGHADDEEGANPFAATPVPGERRLPDRRNQTAANLVDSSADDTTDGLRSAELRSKAEKDRPMRKRTEGAARTAESIYDIPDNTDDCFGSDNSAVGVSTKTSKTKSKKANPSHQVARRARPTEKRDRTQKMIDSDRWCSDMEDGESLDDRKECRNQQDSEQESRQAAAGPRLAKIKAGVRSKEVIGLVVDPKLLEVFNRAGFNRGLTIRQPSVEGERSGSTNLTTRLFMTTGKKVHEADLRDNSTSNVPRGKTSEPMAGPSTISSESCEARAEAVERNKKQAATSPHAAIDSRDAAPVPERQSTPPGESRKHEPIIVTDSFDGQVTMHPLTAGLLTMAPPSPPDMAAERSGPDVLPACGTDDSTPRTPTLLPKEPAAAQNPGPRIANPATRGRKAALKSDAAGQVPRPIIPSEMGLGARTARRPSLRQPQAEDDTTTAAPLERPRRGMRFPGFVAVSAGGPWSKEAHDLLGTVRPSRAVEELS